MRSRILLAIGIIVILIIGTFIALDARPLAVAVCTAPSVHVILSTSIFGDICPVAPPGPALPIATSTASMTTALASGTSRGLSCPDTAVPGEAVTISWSCGASALSEIAGFSIADHAVTSATVTPTASSSTYGIRCADGYESMCSIDTSGASVRIVAQPQHVQLGERTDIFWQSQGATSCEVTGPSFEETGTSGGAATVPITTATTYTAACRTAAGATVSAKVTVDFAE